MTLSDEKIDKLLCKIKPTNKEVKSMSEYEWMTQVYPRKAFLLGMNFEEGKENDW